MMKGIEANASVQNVFQAKSQGYDRAEIQKMARDGEIDCDTCKNRKYQDQSNESVSFKAPAHISPQASASAVRSHEQEHVSNAYAKAGESNAEVTQADVRIQTATCPECGRIYVSGGETTTQIKYNEENPYAQGFKIADSATVAGQNMDMEI